MTRRWSILTVSPSPHERPSTSELQTILAELARRDDVRSSLWFLREGHDGDEGERFTTGGGSPWVVDRLRTWGPARVASALGLEVLAAPLRGRRLRRRLREIAPDLVILDDGVGERILGGAERDVVRVGRANADDSLLAGMDQPIGAAADAWLVGPGASAPAGAVQQRPVAALLDDYRAARRFVDPDRRAELRSAAGVPLDALVVLGWGGGGWLDGSDLFVRVLWALSDRHGIEACGVWVTDDLDVEDEARLVAEAQRCGLADRFAIVRGGPVLRHLGDVVVLPVRCRADRAVGEVVASGVPVVAFDALGWDDAGISLVADLDVDAAAEAVASVVGSDRATLAADARARIDVAALVDDLVALARRGRVP